MKGTTVTKRVITEALANYLLREIGRQVEDEADRLQKKQAAFMALQQLPEAPEPPAESSAKAAAKVAKTVAAAGGTVGEVNISTGPGTAKKVVSRSGAA